MENKFFLFNFFFNMDQIASTFFNSNYMRLYQKTAFKFDFRLWEVHDSESVFFMRILVGALTKVNNLISFLIKS